MSTINDSDLLLVERNGNLHQITYDQMSTLNDDDILLVERGGVQYKVEAQYVSTGPNGVILPSVEVLTPLNGAGLNDGQSYTPMSSAYVSTDSTPIYHRNFPERITTVSGGSWVNENNLFDGTTENASELTGASGVVSQVVFTPHAGWFEGETYIWAYASGGGTIEILDDADSVLRTYTLLTSSGGNTAVGIVRADQKIRFTTTNQNESLYIANVNRGPIDAEITGRVAFEFTDDTDLDKMVAPIIQTDENGNVKIPTTSTVDSTTTITGVNKSMQHRFLGSGYNRTYDAHDDAVGAQIVPVGPRMTWAKVEASGYTGIISDNVSSFGAYLQTYSNPGRYDGGPYLRDNESEYNLNYRWNRQGYYSNIAEIGVAPKVLDIVTWTGDGTTIQEIPHNLGCKPGMIIVKRVEANGNWAVWHKDLTPGKSLVLNNGQGETSLGWFPSEPTKDSFYVTGDSFDTGINGGEYVAYVFAGDTPGKIKCGTYTGTGGSQLVELGFQPGFVLTKDKYNDDSWACANKQCSDNGIFWEPNNDSGMQGASQNFINMNHTTNYMRLQGNDARLNGNTRQYVYLAISADLTGPNSTQLNLLSGQDLEYFTTGTQITSNAAASGSNISFGSLTYSGTSQLWIRQPSVGGDTSWYDIRSRTGNKWLAWFKTTNQGGISHHLFDSERGSHNPIYADLNLAENTTSNDYLVPYDSGAGYRVGPGTGVNSGYNYVSWNFLAAPQFFDVQKYVGTGATQTISHDLGVEPGFIMVKNLVQGNDWICYHSNTGSIQFLKLNENESVSFSDYHIKGASADDFTVGSNGTVNNAGHLYISYIFAKDSPYVKCGTYVGSGASTQVNVGFKPRWMMIKRTNIAGSWIILDKEMDDHTYLKANSNDPQGGVVWNFTSTGVTLVGEWGDLNSSSGSYIYVAIADESEGHPPSPPSTSTVTATPDPNGATMVVNAESFDVGDTASAPALEASITSVAGSDGNKLLVDGSTGTWMPGLYAKGSETTINAPGPDEITFTSQNQGTPAFSGVDATLASRTWTLESGTTATGPWTLVDSYVDYDVLNSQDGATPWTSNKPNLTPNTFYRVKVQYNSTNAESVESVYNTFKTGDA